MQQLSTEPSEKTAQELKTLTMPFGIRLIAMYGLLGALGTMPTGIASLFEGLTLGSIIVGLISIAFGMLFFTSMWGLLKLKMWGYKLSKTVYTIAILFGSLSLALDYSTENILLQGVSIAIAGWIIFYLRKEDIKVHFSQ